MFFTGKYLISCGLRSTKIPAFGRVFLSFSLLLLLIVAGGAQLVCQLYSLVGHGVRSFGGLTRDFAEQIRRNYFAGSSVTRQHPFDEAERMGHPVLVSFIPLRRGRVVWLRPGFFPRSFAALHRSGPSPCGSCRGPGSLRLARCRR